MGSPDQDDMIVDLLRQAEATYRAGDIQGARQIYEAILQIEPDNAQAQEGLALHALTDKRWSNVARSGAGDPALAAALARGRELLASGLVEDAHLVADELLRQQPGHPDVRSLADAVAEARGRAPATAKALLDAREALARGDLGTAMAACRHVLTLDPDHREAERLLEQIELASAGEPSQPIGGAFELELDFPVAPVPPAAPAAPLHHGSAAPSAGHAGDAPRTTIPIPVVTAPPTKAPASPADDLTSWLLPDPPSDTPATPAPAGRGAAPAPPEADDLDAVFARMQEDPAPARGPAAEDRRDLIDAARWLGEVDDVATPEGAEHAARIPEVDADAGEAALLVSRAREELEAGRIEEARRMATRALAVVPTLVGAQEVLGEVQRLNDLAAREAESLLNQAISEFERGRPDLALPLLRHVLTAVPGHPEAIEYLARAEAAEDSVGFQREDLPAPLPLVLGNSDDVPPPLPPPVAPPGEGSYGRAALGRDEGAGAKPPSLPRTAPPTAYTRPDAPPPPRGEFEGGSSSPPPARPAGAAGSAVPSRPKAPARSGGGTGRLATIAGGGLLAVAVLGAAVWYGGPALGLWGGEPAAEVVTEPVRPKPKPAPAASAPAAPAPVPVPATPAVPVLTIKDVPRLDREAQRALAQGREQEAVELYEQALKLDGENYTLIERRDAAREAAKRRATNEAKLKEARDLWGKEDFEEALRIWYRIDERFKPASINRWITNGWYNLGVQRLQGGDLKEAAEFFRNCLEMSPDDAGAKRHLEVVRRYRGKTVDDAYRVYVGNLRLRTMDERN